MTQVYNKFLTLRINVHKLHHKSPCVLSWTCIVIACDMLRLCNMITSSRWQSQMKNIRAHASSKVVGFLCIARLINYESRYVQTVTFKKSRAIIQRHCWHPVQLTQNNALGCSMHKTPRKTWDQRGAKRLSVRAWDESVQQQPSMHFIHSMIEGLMG